MSERLFNFSAGPATLPLNVLEHVQRDLLALPGQGMSILEVSHRSTVFAEILQQAETRLRTLLSIPAEYQLLFLQGGASLQFNMLAMNFLRPGHPGAYVDSGSWAQKALQAGQEIGQTQVIWSGQATNYTHMPQAAELHISGQPAYVHITSNETIQGLALQDDLDLSPYAVCCDASSDILSRPMDLSRYAMIYAGAQKNMGPAGLTLVILHPELLARRRANLPTMLDYQTFVDSGSLYNTPPVFAIYVLNLVAGWLLEQGGLSAMHTRNRHKADLLYAAIDQSEGFYRGHAEPQSRSLMNISFRLPSPALEAEFVKQAQTQGLDGLKGHRSVGGIRASIYNAFPLAGVQALVSLMQDFQQRRG